MTLCPATNRLHKGCHNSNNHRILTHITGVTCSRLSVMNHRWTSCTRLMDTSTLRSLNPTHMRLRLAAHSDGERGAKLFPSPGLSCCNERTTPLVGFFDRSASFPPALVSSYPIWSYDCVLLGPVHPRPPSLLFLLFLFHLVTPAFRAPLPPLPPCGWAS